MTPDKPIKKRGGKGLTPKQRIARIEKAISALQLELPGAPQHRAGVIERQLRLYRETLRVERIHLTSKFHQIRSYKVSGSYGTHK